MLFVSSAEIVVDKNMSSSQPWSNPVEISKYDAARLQVSPFHAYLGLRSEGGNLFSQVRVRAENDQNRSHQKNRGDALDHAPIALYMSSTTSAQFSSPTTNVEVWPIPFFCVPAWTYIIILLPAESTKVTHSNVTLAVLKAQLQGSLIPAAESASFRLSASTQPTKCTFYAGRKVSMPPIESAAAFIETERWGCVTDSTEIFVLMSDCFLAPDCSLGAQSESERALLRCFGPEAEVLSLYMRLAAASDIRDAHLLHVRDPSWTSRAVLLSGPPGVGKTHLATNLARLCGLPTLRVSLHLLLQMSPGSPEEGLASLWALCERCNPCVLLLDPVHALVPSPGSTGSTGSGLWEQAETLARCLVRLLNSARGQQSPLIVAITSDAALVHPLVRSRLTPVRLAAPSAEQRRAIVHGLLGPHLVTEDDQSLDSICDECHGHVAADLVAVCEQAVSRGQELLSALKRCVRSYRPQSLNQLEPATTAVRWSDIGGLSEIKERLQEMVVWPLKHTDLFRVLGVQAPRGVLLFGPPGTGKTMLAAAVAHESSANFINVPIASLMHAGYGDTEKALQRVFQNARDAAPSVIFLDEVQSVFSNRDSSGRFGQKLVAQLLVELDAVALEPFSIVVIAATNIPSALDKALLRPGRFERVLYVPPPSIEGREQVLEVLKSTSVWAPDVHIAALAQATAGFTGADLRSLCRRAALKAILRAENTEYVEARDFDTALREVSPSITPACLCECESFQKRFNGR